MPIATHTQKTERQKSTSVVAVIGNPNSGKTTLFNALTGLRHKVGNYPGVTVEKREGALISEPSIHLLDLPGTYSLSACSPDEQITRNVLLGRMADTPRPDAVLIVVDALNLERNLFLATQVIELGLPTIIACNMMDIFAAAGHKLDREALATRLGSPVIATVGCRREGLDELDQALRSLCLLREHRVCRSRAWTAPEPLEKEIQSLASAMADCAYTDASAVEGAAILLLSEGEVRQDDHLPAVVRDSLSASLRRLIDERHIDVSFELTASRYAWLGQLVDPCLTRTKGRMLSRTDRLDRILTHRLWGMAIFAVMMAGLFYSIFVLADPLIGVIETGIGWTQAWVQRSLPAGPLQSLLANGVIAGAGNVLAFFPQICILFAFLAVLEDSGYMSRAAFLMDRIMSRVGLHGKSFIPLLSCHACAIPGILATRTIENRRDRLATILVAPLMSCSARLPVYSILIAACLPGPAWIKAVVLLALYVLGIATALGMAIIFKKTLLPGPRPVFLMELPPYHIPRPGAVLSVMWDHSREFLQRAGTIILAITVLLWVLMSYPTSADRANRHEQQRTVVKASPSADLNERLAVINNAEAAENLANSYAGQLGRWIEPAIRPLGYDWRIGIGLVASFAAREVFVGTMGVVYSVGEHGDEASMPLRQQIATATWPDGSKVYTPLVAVSLLLFYVLACQCVSTLAVIRSETRSWRWPVFVYVYMTSLAYLAALLVYQVGSALGLAAT